MKRGLILGKFYPLHNGHLSLFEYGANKCDELYLLVCKEESEKIPLQTRVQWVKESVNRYLSNYNIKIISFEYNDKDLPSTSESSYDISLLWSKIIKEKIPDLDIIIGSEKYVEYLSEILGIEYSIYDINRTIVNISATKIRNDLFKNFKYLPYDVRKTYTKKIIILGSESTGKSTLTKLLAQYYNTEYVPEVARDLIPSSENYTSDDLINVVKAHSDLIEKTIPKNNPLLFIDTDIHITQSYNKFKYNDYLFVPNSDFHFSVQKGDLYIYLDNNTPFIQDGTRLKNTYNRDLLDSSHRKTLSYFGVEYTQIKSYSYEERFQDALNIINDFIKNIKL